MATYLHGVAGIPDYPNMRALMSVTVEVDVTVTAVATTDIFVPVPKGSRIQDVRFVTDTAFGAATDAQLSLGKTSGGQEYLALATVKAQGVYEPAFVAAAAADYENLPQDGVYARIVQTGAFSATGSGKLYIDYARLA